MVGDEKPVYLEYDMPDADFIKKKNEEEDEEKNPSDDEMSICSIQSIDPELKSKLTAAVSDRNISATKNSESWVDEKLGPGSLHQSASSRYGSNFGPANH